MEQWEKTGHEKAEIVEVKTIRYITTGDIQKARGLLGEGRHQLSILNNSMTFQDLKQSNRIVRFDNGTTIACSTVFGQSTIAIHVPVIKEVPVIEVQIPEKVWQFKLYRDDDTTIRDEFGNITTPSGLPIGIYDISNIYIINDDFTYSSLPGHHGWASAYWTYNEDTGIWTFDDSIDYPDTPWKGTYNTNTGYFTVETFKESSNGLYGVYFEMADPTIELNPAEDEATSTSIIDGYPGVNIRLSEEGNPQTLQPPTDIVAGRTFVVVNAQYGSDSFPHVNININGITLALGEHQGFIWNGTSWETSDIDLMYGLDVVYPYEYKGIQGQGSEVAYQKSEKISIGEYKVNIPYWKECKYTYSPTPIEYASLYPCDDYAGFGFSSWDYFWKDSLTRKRILKTSIPYSTTYQIFRGQIVFYAKSNSDREGHCPPGCSAPGDKCMFQILPIDLLECCENEDGENTCSNRNLYETGSSLADLVKVSAGDGTFSSVKWSSLGSVYEISSDEKPRPENGEVENSVILVNHKPHSEYYYRCVTSPPLIFSNRETSLLHLALRLTMRILYNFEDLE